MTHLRAGNLTALFDGADLRYVSVGRREIVRRIYITVRDTRWGTLPATIRALNVDQQADGFVITYLAEHQQDDMSMVWVVRIFGEATRHSAQLHFNVDGQAGSTFQTNRVGLCLLHPVTEMVGRSVRIEHTDGSPEMGEFPQLISPHRLFTDIRAIHDGGVIIDFAGEAFETEDQRNWADTSFKTYCRPLSRGFPYELKHRERVRHSITVMASQPDAAEATAPIPLRVLPRVIGRVPSFGLPADVHVVYQDRRAVPEPLLLEAAKREHPHKRVGIGTIGSFGEINRHRDLAAAADVIAYALNPQVHAMDDLSLIENLAAQGDTVRTARSFAPRAHIHVGPITLSRQPDPFAAGNDGSPVAATRDPRCDTPLAQAWAAASLKYLAEAGADSVAYADVELAPEFRDLAGQDVLEVTNPQPLRFAALAVPGELFVINLLDEQQSIPVQSVGEVDLPPFGIRRVEIS